MKVVKDGMCRGCWALSQKIQKQFWDESGRRQLAIPKEVMKPFCTHHGLHIEYMKHVVEGDQKCLNYYNNNMD